MKSTKNPEARAINQKQGPRTGNAGTASKRSSFLKEKETNYQSYQKNFLSSAHSYNALPEYV